MEHENCSSCLLLIWHSLYQVTGTQVCRNALNGQTFSVGERKRSLPILQTVVQGQAAKLPKRDRAGGNYSALKNRKDTQASNQISLILIIWGRQGRNVGRGGQNTFTPVNVKDIHPSNQALHRIFGYLIFALGFDTVLHAGLVTTWGCPSNATVFRKWAGNPVEQIKRPFQQTHNGHVV